MRLGSSYERVLNLHASQNIRFPLWISRDVRRVNDQPFPCQKRSCGQIEFPPLEAILVGSAVIVSRPEAVGLPSCPIAKFWSYYSKIGIELLQTYHALSVIHYVRKHVTFPYLFAPSSTPPNPPFGTTYDLPTFD